MTDRAIKASMLTTVIVAVFTLAALAFADVTPWLVALWAATFATIGVMQYRHLIRARRQWRPDLRKVGPNALCRWPACVCRRGVLPLTLGSVLDLLNTSNPTYAIALVILIRALNERGLRDAAARLLATLIKWAKAEQVKLTESGEDDA